MTYRMLLLLVLSFLASMSSSPVETISRYDQLNQHLFMRGFQGRVVMQDKHGVDRVYRHGLRRSESGGVISFAVLTVCADASCTYDNSDAEVQQSLDDADPGDTVLWQRNQTYINNSGDPNGWVLPPKVCVANDETCIITVKTGVESNGNLIPEGDFPAEGIRSSVGYGPDGVADGSVDYRPVYANITSSENNFAGMRTATPAEFSASCSVKPCVTKWWRIQHFDFLPRLPYAGGPMLVLGSHGGTLEVAGSDSGSNLTVHASVNTDVLPDNHTVAATDVGLRVHITTNTGGWTSHFYRVMSIQGSYWRLDRSPAATGTTGGAWSSGDIQDLLTEVPEHFDVKQNNFLGDPVVGQFRGLTVAANYVNVEGNYFDNIKSISETQAIFATNAQGPLRIHNNYIEASTENIMIGGADPYIGRFAPFVTVLASPAPTTTTARLSDVTELIAHRWITFEVGGQQKSVKVTNVDPVTKDVTFVTGANGALPSAPDSPGRVRWTVTFGGVTVTQNHITKPMDWYGPIVGTPSSRTATGFTSGGSLTAGTYGYRIRALHPISGAETAYGNLTTEVTTSVASGSSGRVEVSWAAVTNATDYLVYRSTGGTAVRWTVTAATTFTDTGTGGTADTATEWFTSWRIKNVFELKACDGLNPAGPCLIEGNIIERAWVQSQTGSCLLLKNSNQDGGDVSVVTRFVTVRRNIIRDCATALETCATDCVANRHTGRMDSIVFEENLIYNLGPFWGASRDSIQLSTGSNASFIGNQNHDAMRIEHNTIVHDPAGSGIVFVITDPNNTGTVHALTNHIFRNNWGRRLEGRGGYRAETSGGVQGEGTVSWNIAAPSGIWGVNGIANTVATYPSVTLKPTESQFQASFVNYAASDFRCAAGAPCDNAGSDGLDLGVSNFDALFALTNVALSGNDSGAQVMTITTATPLPNATYNIPYSTSITTTGGTGPYTCSLTAGALPTGITLSSACLVAGTPSVVGGFTFTVRSTDALGAFTSKAFALTVVLGTGTGAPLTSAQLYNWTKGALLDGTLNLSGSTLKVMLVRSTYSFNPDHTFIDVSGAAAARATGTTDQTLTSKSFGVSNTTDLGYMTAADVTFTAIPAGQVIGSIVVYIDTGTPATSRLVGWAAIAYTSTGSNLRIQWPTTDNGAVMNIR